MKFSTARIHLINENHRNIIKTEYFYNNFMDRARHYFTTRKLLRFNFRERHYFSTRLNNLFKDNNLITISDVVSLKHQEFISLIGSGPMTSSELLSIIESELISKLNAFDYQAEKEIIENKELRIQYFSRIIKNIDSNNDYFYLESLLGTPIFKERFNLTYVYELKEFNIDQIDTDDEILINFKIIDILSMLALPITDLISIKFTSLINKLDSVSLDVLHRRSYQQTLEQIGLKYDLTRERVRQLESLALKRLRSGREFLSITSLLNSKFYPVCFAMKNQLEIIFKQNTALFTLLIKDNYHKKLEFYYANNAAKETIFAEIEELPFEVAKTEIDELVAHSSYRGALKKHILENYHFYGQYGFKTPPKLFDLYTPIIKLYFDTIIVGNDQHIERFKKHYSEHYEDPSIFQKTNRSITAILQRLPKIVVVGRGEYKYASAEISLELKNKLINTMQKNETLLINGLFVLHEVDLKEEGVTNRFQLHGVIRNNIPELYCNRDYVSINPLSEINSFQLIKDYVDNIDRIFTLKEIQTAIAGLTPVMVNSYVGITNELIQFYNVRFLPVKIIKLTEKERAQIYEQIAKYLKNNKFITSVGLYEYIFLLFFPKVAKQYEISNPFDAYTFVRHLFPTKFNYLISTLTLPEDEPLDHEQYIVNEFAQKNLIVVDQITAFAKKNYLRLYNLNDLLERFYEIGYIRIDNNRLFHGNALQINQVFIMELENVLIRNLTSGKIETKEIESFNVFPRFTIPWNEHLLAHLIRNFSEKLVVEKIGTTYREITYIIKEKQNG